LLLGCFRSAQDRCVFTLWSNHGKICRAGSENAPVDLITLEVHEGRVFGFHTDLFSASAWKAFDPLGFAQPAGVELNAHFDAAIGPRA
jgi:hypothetical protein